MSSNSPLVPPDIMPPLPPVVQAVVLIFSVFMTLALTAFIGFVIVETTADMIGHPLWMGTPDSPEEDLWTTEQNTNDELKSPFELITPIHQTRMLGPEVVVIYTVRTMPTALPDLRVNDIQHPWDMQYGNNTWFARLQLPEGLHRLRAGEAEAEFFVASPDSTHYLSEHLPELWRWHYPHPNTNKVDLCTDCHKMSDQLIDPFMIPRNRTIGAWAGASSCFACHEEEEHEIVHRFVLPTTARNPQCVRCHSIH